MTDWPSGFKRVLWIPATALLLAGLLALTPLFQRLDALFLDTQMRLVAENQYFDDVLVIDIDDPSLQVLRPYFGSWPYTRDTYALLVDYLSEMGAKSIAFDIVFADPREGDARFQQSISRAGNVVLAAAALSEKEEGEKDEAGQAHASLTELAWPVSGDKKAYAWPGVQVPLSALSQSSPHPARVGVVSVIADRDGQLRRIPLFHRFNTQVLPSFPLAAHFSGLPIPQAQDRPGGRTQVGQYAWATDGDGAVRLIFPRNKNSILTMAFARIGKAMLGLPGEALDPELFRGKTIFVGSTAFFSDRVVTPVGEMTGVHVLAIAHQALAKHLVLAPQQAGWTALLVLVAIFPTVLLLRWPRRSQRSALGVNLATGALIYGSHLVLLVWFRQESALLLPLLVLLIAHVLEQLQAVHVRNKEQTSEIQVLASNDALTRLPNRFAMQAQLAWHIDRQRDAPDVSLTVLLVGLDKFKAINNAFGHEVGDQVLIEVARRLRGVIHAGDYLARLGGDEFVAVFSKDATADSARERAQAMLDLFARPFVLGEQEIFLGANIGISVYPADGTDVAGLLKSANSAMRSAKEQGRNTCVLFAQNLGQAAMERLLIENQLRQALSRNELVLFYQPQTNIRSGRMVAVEALVRWNHPERGLLSPDSFIPTAEDSDLVMALGEWVLRTACQQMHQWHAAGLTDIGRVAVNLSARQFEQADLPEFVASVLEETQLDAHFLELEITESVAMTDPERSIDVLNKLLSMGITLALDDFGTGYSSLTYLKLFPITSLKIDGSFVQNIETDRYDAEICSAIVSMARKLGLKVIAEGVETPGQFRFLRDIECVEAQGYLVSRPLSASDLESFKPPPVPA